MLERELEGASAPLLVRKEHTVVFGLHHLVLSGRIKGTAAAGLIGCYRKLLDY